MNGFLDNLSAELGGLVFIGVFLYLIVRISGYIRKKRDFLAAPFVGVENIISIMIWPLFIALTIFQNNSYAAIGLLASVSTALALIAIYLIGSLIDQSKGLIMLKVGAILNAGLS